MAATTGTDAVAASGRRMNETMDSTESRAEGLAAAARTHRDELLALAEPIAGWRDVTVKAAPEPGTVLAELATPIGRQCLTEVIVTTAEVVVAGNPGWACVLGWDAEAALAAALLEAADPDAAARLGAAALGEEERRQAANYQRVRGTRMDVA